MEESDKGSYYNIEELLNEIDNDCDHEDSEQAEMMPSRAKISLELEETVEAGEIDEELDEVKRHKHYFG